MSAIFARKALLSGGWADNVRLDIDAGRVVSIATEAQADGSDAELGIIIPGLANAHSHAFQRVLAGHTEERAPSTKDNFWTWRSRMYALSAKIDAASLEAIARQVYGEMVATGYTSVAEFHYLHNEPGAPQTSEAMFEAIASRSSPSLPLTITSAVSERACSAMIAALALFRIWTFCVSSSRRTVRSFASSDMLTASGSNPSAERKTLSYGGSSIPRSRK